MSRPLSNLELLLGLLFESDGGPIVVEVPYTYEGERQLFAVTLEEGHVGEILMAVRRAANAQAIATGQLPPFPDPLCYPDPDSELKRQTRREVARLLSDLEHESDTELRLKALKEARTALSSLAPSVSLKQAEWDKLVRAFRKLQPGITDDEVLALL